MVRYRPVRDAEVEKLGQKYSTLTNNSLWNLAQNSPNCAHSKNAFVFPTPLIAKNGFKVRKIGFLLFFPNSH